MVPSKDDCYYLGYISKTKGFKGELIVFFDVDDLQAYKKLSHFLVDLHGVLTPFFIERMQLKQKNFAEVKLENVNSGEEAKVISGCDLFLPLKNLPDLPDDQYYLHELEGMEVIDKVNGPIGLAEKVIDFGKNPLIQVFYEGNEVLIPIADNFVTKVDKASKKIHVDLPEGLLEINS